MNEIKILQRIKSDCLCDLVVFVKDFPFNLSLAIYRNSFGCPTLSCIRSNRIPFFLSQICLFQILRAWLTNNKYVFFFILLLHFSYLDFTAYHLHLLDNEFYRYHKFVDGKCENLLQSNLKSDIHTWHMISG